MYRKALLALAAATALAAAAPAQANHTLAHRVALLTEKLNCLTKYPVYSFGDYAYSQFETDFADKGSDQIEVLVPDVLQVNALDFDYGSTNPQPSDAFLLGVKRTRACLAKFATATNPVSARRAAPAKMARLR
jgi:hypothetical protein